MQTADDSIKGPSQTLRLTLVLYIFKWVLYFNSVIIGNQIKYYIAKNRGNLLNIQYGFYSYALPLSAMIACYWKGIYQELKEVNVWNMNIWSVLLEGHQFSLFLWQEELKHWMPREVTTKWYLTSWNKYTNTQPWHL